MIISLIGYRGTGKSTVARLVAEQLDWQAVDADEAVEQVAGKSIQAIFADDGESAFRDWEGQVVAELVQEDELVVAWGGGAILRDMNRRAMTGAGPIVWLKADAVTIAARVEADPATSQRRPNLTVAGGLDEINALLAERLPIYQRLADLQVDTQGSSPAEVAATIGDWLGRRGLLGD